MNLAPPLPPQQPNVYKEVAKYRQTLKDKKKKKIFYSAKKK
jgi:hypothetical protein